MAQRNDFENLPKLFLQAARDGNIAMVKEYLESGININVQDPQTGKTALHLAAQNSRDDMIKILLKNPLIDPNILDNTGLSPLMHALSRCIRHTNSSTAAESLIASSKVNCDMVYYILDQNENTAAQYIIKYCQQQPLLRKVLEDALAKRCPKPNRNQFTFFTASELGIPTANMTDEEDNPDRLFCEL